jgi:hypothetical protein
MAFYFKETIYLSKTLSLNFRMAYGMRQCFTLIDLHSAKGGISSISNDVKAPVICKLYIVSVD